MLKTKDLTWSVPLALVLGAGFSFIERGGWLAFFLLAFLALAALTSAARWANGGKPLAWMVALAFGLRLLAGVSTYLLLPINGFTDEDDRAGFVFTDAHRRDEQAWQLAESDRSLMSGFSEKYAYDQYGGLLTFSALIYRYFSPDAHRPLMLVLVSAFFAALGLPFLWKAAALQWNEKIALAACWLYALYPESVLLGGAAMREPYLMAFSAFALWGFVASRKIWLALGLAGMLLVSPAVALATLILLGGWILFARAGKALPVGGIAAALALFLFGLVLLSSALNRSGGFDSSSPLQALAGWLKFAVQWDVYQLERGSGWVQKLFDEMPSFLRLPFVIVYGVFQPVLPAAIVEPTTLTWKVIALLRAFGWYALLPLLIFAPLQAWHDRKENPLWLWLSVFAWAWILFAALRGGGDQWDNPRYRAILFLWQALVAAYAWGAFRRNAWGARIVWMEALFLLVFGQWYASRYFHWGGQLPFAGMVALILTLWAGVAAGGIWRDKHRV
ncbi:MAG: hypothetical protein Fur002_12240 [Anaerolineales bacterium]